MWYNPDDDRQAVAEPQAPALVSSLRSIALVDISGSTAGAILAAEKRMVHDFDAASVVVWGSSASLITRAAFDKLGAGGGTCPSALYRTANVVEAMHSSALVVFCTDGEVPQAEVSQFSRQCGEHFSHAALIVCVLCTSRTAQSLSQARAPGSIDVSVFAPLLAFPNVLLLHLSTERDPDYRVMNMSSGVRELMLSHDWHFADKRLLPTLEFDLSSWEALPSVTPAELRAVHVDPVVGFVHMRPGYRLMSNGQAFNFEVLMQTTPILALDSPADWQRLVSEMSSIAHLAKNEGNIPQLRQWIDRQRYELHQRVAAGREAFKSADPSLQTLRASGDEIVARLHIRVSRADEDGAGEEGAPSAEQLAQLRLDLKNERAALAAALDGVRARCDADPELRLLTGYLTDSNEWLAILQGFEQSSYSSSDVLRSLGNRAMRARPVQQIDLEEGLASVDWTGAPKVECRICCETEYACIVLRYDPAKPELRKEAIDLNGTDFVMNVPLACGRANLLFLSSDVYCRGCAQYLWDNGRQDTVRSIIAGLMPVAPWAPHHNRRLFSSTLAHALGDGRDLPHLFLLYFALLDAATTKEWTSDYRPVLEYVQAEMRQHVKATSDFQETGRKLPLGAAMQTLTSSDGLPDLMRQPIQAVFVIMRHSLLLDYRKGSQPDIRKLTFIHAVLVEKYLRVLVERYCLLVRPNGTAEENLQKEGSLLRQLFDALYDCEGPGIPKHGTGRLAREPQSGARPAILESLMPSSLKAVIDADWTRLWQALRAGHLPQETADHFASQNAPVPDISPPAALTLVLQSFIGLEYLPAEQLLSGASSRFAKLSTWFLLAEETEVVAGLNSQMFRRLPSREQLTDRSGIHTDYGVDEVPAFVNIHGPSSLFCGCGYDFYDETMHELSGDGLADAIRTRRGLHFTAAYGSGNPSQVSLHVHLHRTVMAVVRETYPLPVKEAKEGEQTGAASVTVQLPVIPSKPTREMVIAVLSRLYKRGIGATRGNVFRAELVGQVVVLLTDYLRVWKGLWEAYLIDPNAFTSAHWKRPSSLAVKIAYELGLESCNDTKWWQGEALVQARRRAVNLSARDADPDLSAPLTAEEMQRVLPTAAVKAAFK